MAGSRRRRQIGRAACLMGTTGTVNRRRTNLVVVLRVILAKIIDRGADTKDSATGCQCSRCPPQARKMYGCQARMCSVAIFLAL